MLKQSLLCLGLAACLTLPTWAETTEWGRWSTIRFPGRVSELQPYGFYVDTPSHLHIYVRQDQRVLRNGQLINPAFLETGNNVQIVVPPGAGQIRLRDDNIAVLSTPDGLAQVPEDNLELAMDQARLSALAARPAPSGSSQYYLGRSPVSYAPSRPANPVYSNQASYYLSSYDPPLASYAYSYPANNYSSYPMDYSYPVAYTAYPVGYNSYSNPDGSFNWGAAAVSLVGTAIAASLNNQPYGYNPGYNAYAPYNPYVTSYNPYSAGYSPYAPAPTPYYNYTNPNGSFNWQTAAVTLAGTALANGLVNTNYAYSPYSTPYVNYNPTYVNYSNAGWNPNWRQRRFSINQFPAGTNGWNRQQYHVNNFSSNFRPWNRGNFRGNHFQPRLGSYQPGVNAWNRRTYQPRVGNWNRGTYRPRLSSWNRGSYRSYQPRASNWNRGNHRSYQPRVSSWNRGNYRPQHQQPRFNNFNAAQFNGGRGFRNFNPGGGGGFRHHSKGGGGGGRFQGGGGFHHGRH